MPVQLYNNNNNNNNKNYNKNKKNKNNKNNKNNNKKHLFIHMHLNIILQHALYVLCHNIILLLMKYRKISVISPELIQLCKGFWVGL